MMEFAWPWMFAALPLPLLVRWFAPAATLTAQAALRVPVLDEFRYGAEETASREIARPIRWLLATLAWVLLVASAARPEWLGAPLELPVTGRDLMLAVDLSGSMREEDFVLDKRRVNRLKATKAVAGEFIQRRRGDRLGLVLFGEHAYLQTPLTFDRDTVRTLLEESAIGLAGGEATAIGDAIGLAVKKLVDSPQPDHVLVLLTDGVNNAGEVQPLKAAELASQMGLKIYTIGVGADEILVRDLFGTRRVNPSRDLDEATLRAIAEQTGGRYFRARDSEQLSQIYRILDQLEPAALESRVFRPVTSLYMWPLGAALLCALLLVLIPALRERMP